MKLILNYHFKLVHAHNERTTGIIHGSSSPSQVLTRGKQISSLRAATCRGRSSRGRTPCPRWTWSPPSGAETPRWPGPTAGWSSWPRSSTKRPTWEVKRQEEQRRSPRGWRRSSGSGSVQAAGSLSRVRSTRGPLRDLRGRWQTRHAWPALETVTQWFRLVLCRAVPDLRGVRGLGARPGQPPVCQRQTVPVPQCLRWTVAPPGGGGCEVLTSALLQWVTVVQPLTVWKWHLVRCCPPLPPFLYLSQGCVFRNHQ